MVKLFKAASKTMTLGGFAQNFAILNFTENHIFPYNLYLGDEIRGEIKSWFMIASLKLLHFSGRNNIALLKRKP